MSASANTATLLQSWNVPELRRRLSFMLWAIMIFVIGTHIPAPGIDHAAVQRFFEATGQGGLFGFFDMFSGGALRKLSIFALGIMPYINASIMMQILVAVYPALKQMQQEGEEGRKKISKWTRWLAVGLAILQGGGLLIGIYSTSGVGFLSILSDFNVATALFAVVGGTCFLMWMADEISQKGVGNGASILIMIGIMIQVPGQVMGEMALTAMENHRVFALLLFLLLTIVVVAGIVWVQLSARRIPIQYARRQIGRRTYGGQSTYLPIKITQAGVIPIIFAISVLMIPPTLLGFMGANHPWNAGWAIFSNSLWYAVVEFGLVFAFTFVYTAVTFQTQDVADNLKKNNGFVPGIRPGRPTFEFLDRVLHRITFFGACFLGFLAILPILSNMLIQGVTNVQITSLYLGGTSLLIVVGVALDTVQQMQAHMIMRHYSGFNR